MYNATWQIQLLILLVSFLGEPFLIFECHEMRRKHQNAKMVIFDHFVQHFNKFRLNSNVV